MSEEGRASTTRELWASIVKRVVSVLEENGIQYHVDASSSLYVHGVEFEMDDLDVTVEWGAIETVAELFKDRNPSEFSKDYPPSFKFPIANSVVHIMSYRSDSGIGDEKDRVQVEFNGVKVWSKSISYYQKHMSPEHRLHGPLQQYLERSNN